MLNLWMTWVLPAEASSPLRRCEEFATMARVGVAEAAIVSTVEDQTEKFTLEEIACLASMSVSPAVMKAVALHSESEAERQLRLSVSVPEDSKADVLKRKQLEVLVGESVEQSVGKVGLWKIDVSQSLMDDSFTVVGMVEGKVVSGTMPGGVVGGHPNLVFRCHESEVDLFVVTGRAAKPELGKYNSVSARVRVDKNQAFLLDVYESTDNKALFFPDAMLRRSDLFQGQTLLFEYVPILATPVTLEFPILGMSAVAATLAVSCPSSFQVQPLKK
jgi:hypothetical protein